MTDSLHSDESGVRPGGQDGRGPGGLLGRLTNTSRSDSVTCPSCHVTVTLSKNADGRRRMICPYCGTTYSQNESQIRALQPSSSDPLRHLRLPIVDGSGSISSLMVGRLGGVSVGVPDVHGIMIRPESTTSCASLPPIAKNGNELQLQDQEMRYEGGNAMEDRTVFRMGSGSSEVGIMLPSFVEEQQTNREEFM